MDLDDLDRRLINAIQSDFPLDQRPYQVIAGRLGLSEDDVLARISRLKERGVIRRIGANFVPEKLGYVSTLCAARVPEEDLPLFARTVNAYSGVTHNYIRENHFNVWFTFIAPSLETIDRNLAEISRQTGIKDIFNLPATTVFKIRAEFNL